MRICVVGTGYVGLVVGTCLSDTGQYVVCVDSDPEKVQSLQAGVPTIYESGLKELLERNVQAGRLTFTQDLASAIADANVIFVAVGTPPADDGSVDMSQVTAVAEEIAQHARDHKIVVMKSTVPVGTYKEVARIFSEKASVGIDYVSNPEFLKEGNAIDDFTKPDRVIIGSENRQAGKTVAHLYSPFMRQSNRVIMTDPASAELAKYAVNTILATRITFMNEIARLADRCGASVEDIRRCVGSDRRIGTAFLFPGIGYGGFCFPKDVQGLAAIGRENGCEMRIAEATTLSNRQQTEYFLDVIDRQFRGNYEGRKIAAWGLAYKARTDDIRMSPAVAIVRRLAEKGAAVTVYDPKAMPKAKRELGDRVAFADDMYGVLAGADALIVLTEWQEFRNPDLERVRAAMRDAVIVDGRNLYDLEDLRDSGFRYYSVGRPAVLS